MTKYIVKNCPCYELGKCNNEHIGVEYCQDCTDCPIKQVVWFVKMDNAVCNHVKGRVPVVNNKVLQILQVEGVE